MTGWCWVQPADALTGAVVRCCDRQWIYLVSPGRTSRREGYFPCQVRPPGSPYSDDCDGHLWLDDGGACRG